MTTNDPGYVMRDPNGTTDYRLPKPVSKTTAQLIRDHGDEGFKIHDHGSPAEAIGLGPGTYRLRDFKDEDLHEMHKRELASGRSWRFVPAPNEVRTETVWHYTGPEGFIGAVSRGALWATSLSSMNDSQEYAHGLGLLTEIVDQVRESRRIHPVQKNLLARVADLASTDETRASLFCISASLEPDHINQWRAYGKDQGHALLLSTAEPLATIGDKDQVSSDPNTRLTWRKVLYEPNEQRDLLTKLCGYIVNTTVLPGDTSQAQQVPEIQLARDLVAALACCKHPSWSPEREVRLLVTAAESTTLNFRRGQAGVTPYVEVTLAPPSQVETTEPFGLPITGACVGPFQARQDSARGVRRLLDTFEYQAPTSISESTLREP